MAVTNTNDSDSMTTGVVTIRIPCGADSGLVGDAEERLSRSVHLEDVTIDELSSIEPKLSASVITVQIRLRWTTTMTDEEIRDRLAEVPGLESVVRIE